MFADIPSLKQKSLKGILSLHTRIFSCLDLNVSFKFASVIRQVILLSEAVRISSDEVKEP